MSEIEEKIKAKPPVVQEPQDDALENYRGQWGIAFVKRDGSHHIDLDEHHDTEEIALRRIEEAERGLDIAILMVRTRSGLIAIGPDEYAYGYPIPLGGGNG